MSEVRLIDGNALAKSPMAKMIDSYLYYQCNLTVGLAAALMPEIEAEPAVNRMIPCNERLPEKDKDVLLCQSNGDYVVGYLCSDDVFDTDCGFMGLDKITHWMPLPESIS